MLISQTLLEIYTDCIGVNYMLISQILLEIYTDCIGVNYMLIRLLCDFSHKVV